MQQRIDLGDRVRDVITGFEGIVVCETMWLQGCRRITVQPECLHEGKRVDTETFDETQLKLLQAEAVSSPNRTVIAQTGGPRPEPRRDVAPR